MTEQPSGKSKKIVNQTNNGPGTFVNGNVFGNILNVFATSHRRRSSAAAPDDRALIPDDDYEDVGSWLLVSGFLVAGFAVGCARVVIQGEPLGGDHGGGWWGRVVDGFIIVALFFAAVAACMARAAQGFELWAGRCADLAVETRTRVFAYPPAGMARLLATACSVTASMAAFVAMFFGWSTFGATIQERAHIARDNAAVNAARARAAAWGKA
ncbi:hypothetical protein OH717_17735 [Streptomyces albidoflavus]|uniref:hypothetical protein n=1 Tax=Streptomyces koyangensis TaxID=188770 RepID=UPI003D050530|nr:hypothetical protein OH717_17735 [Streptomyces albidoflavus]